MTDAAATMAQGEVSFRPTREADVQAAVAWAVAEGEPLEIVGHGSKRTIGRPMQTAHTLSLVDLDGLTMYEPEELVLTAQAGTPLSAITEKLAENGQELQFDPIDYGPLLGNEARQGTIGGTIAANLSGPRRLKVGAARDHVLGIRAVTGRGEIIKSGGRVVKNVTGYDLSKGLTGSWGTLAVLTEVTLKVMPRCETEATLVLTGLNDAEATAAMAQAVGSSAEVSAAAHLPESVRARFLGGQLKGAATIMRIEGFSPSVDYRFSSLAGALAEFGACERIDGTESQNLWREVRDVTPFCDETMQPVWRVSVAPSRGHELVAALRLRAGADAFYDWQGGLVWLRMEAGADADLVRATIRALGGGHATLVRASPEMRAEHPVFQPQPAALAALSARLKNQFDPNGVLNPGRMVAP